MSERTGFDVAVLIQAQNRAHPGLHSPEVVKMAGALIDAHRRLFDIVRAVGKVYFAAWWSPDRKCDAAGLWTYLRDAAGIAPGAGTTLLGPKHEHSFAWLIESADSPPYRPRYLKPMPSSGAPFGHPWRYWTLDVNQALRLSRKDDAEALLAYLGVGREYARVCEHGWVS